MSNAYKNAVPRLDLAANLTADAPLLPSNVFAIESDTGRIKIGLDTTAYASLYYAIGGGFRKVKTADEARTSTTTLADDDTLTCPIAASTKYRVRIRAFFDTAATPDFKFALAGPATPTLIRIFRKHIDPTNLTTLVVASEVDYTASTAVAAGTGTTGGFLEFEIILHNGSTAGTLSLQWAQNTSNASATTVRAGSMIEWEQIG